ncbi:MAG: sugar phosphate isomerase/epimerase family protein [Chloroflexota bacterium]
MFELAVFADDIDQDLNHALDVMAELGLKWLEIRSAWGQNLVHQPPEKVQAIHQAIHSRGLRLPCIAAPLFKSRLKGQGEVSQERFFAQEQDDMAQQIAILQRAVEIARLFETNLIRCFSFWRIGADPTPIWSDLRQAFSIIVPLAEQAGMVLVLENDFECNLGSGEQAARLIEQIDSPHLRLLWDPGNAYFVGEQPYPTGYERSRHLIGHVHLKDADIDPQTGRPRWVALGSGNVDLRGQLRALQADGYQGVITMENHFTPPNGSKEAGLRQSFAGLQQLMAEM